MVNTLSRRGFLAGTASLVPSLAFAGAPASSLRPLARGEPVVVGPSAAEVVKAGGVSGQTVYAIADLATGEMLEGTDPALALPPASVTKAVTAAYGLNQLSAEYQFPTLLLVDGTVTDGVLDGDLILQGSGDPTLDTDRLADLVIDLRNAGIWQINGRFIMDGGDFPLLRSIDPRQPVQVGYNPAIAGLNLNYNRVRFDWSRLSSGRYKITMRATGKYFEPDTPVSRVIVKDRASPVYDHRMIQDGEEWSVARGPLGKGGGRWLPTRVPMLYCGEAFRGIARELQVRVPAPEIGRATATAQILAETRSEPLVDVARDMLKFSTNLTAEVVGFAASGQKTLGESAIALTNWARAQGLEGTFADHSGLSDQSLVTAQGLVGFMLRQRDTLLPTVLKPFNAANGKPLLVGGQVQAKTGSLNFVSALSGYLIQGEKAFAFAIISADLKRRAAIKPEDMERPDGGGYWAKKARNLQRELLKNWALRL